MDDRAPRRPVPRGAVAGLWATALLTVVALAASCAGDRAATPSTTTSTTTGAAAGGDIEYLAERILAVHPDPHHHVEPGELRRRVVDDPADDDELLVAAMRLANLGPGEGHGGVYPWSQPGLDAWPLHLYDLPDGIRMVGGDGPPIGSRLVAVGGTPIDEVVEAVRPLVPHDTEATVRSRLPAYLAFPAVLRGLGVDPAELTWELPDGATVTLPPPEPITTEAFRDLLGLFQDQVPPTLPYDRDRIFWSERRGAATYVRWNQVQGRDGETSLSELATSLVDEVARGEVTRVVVDARHNPGGDIGRARALELGVREIEASRPGTVRFLVGRGTFSAASYVIARLAAETDVVLVGEPTGGSSRSFADPLRVDLPTSGIRAYVNRSLYESGEATWGPLEPDIAATPSWDDIAAGRDPALDAALAG